MSRLKVRCLGEFEVRFNDERVTTFESQKVKALFAYLACHQDRSFSREHLAGLLWPEKEEDAARRNLRQAAYNLKSALPGGSNDELSPILATRHTVQLNPDFNCWLDVETFDNALSRGTGQGTIDPYYLVEAVGLYRGDFLSGLTVKDSPPFELWLLTEQERLREAATEAIRTLLESYLARGEFRLGIRYARRLVSMDPFSEQAHRFLMRFYSLSGRRGRALTQYEELRDLLNNELGVEPMEESRTLFETILAERQTTPKRRTDSEPGGPLIPLIGRKEPYNKLRECWDGVLEGHKTLTLVEGEPGVGKTRLVSSFLDAASSQPGTVVLKGRCDERLPLPYQPFAQVLHNAAIDDSERADNALRLTPQKVLADVATLAPEIHKLLPDLPTAALPIEPEQLFESITTFLAHFCRPQEARTLVLLLDDLHWAAPETCALLRYLMRGLPDTKFWIVATVGSASFESGHPLASTDWPGHLSSIRLTRLQESEVSEIAAALVGDDQAPRLVDLLRRANGLPLAIAEWINFLWDSSALLSESGHWRLEDLSSLEISSSAVLEEPIVRRLRRLPTSTRRLAALAAVAGQKFEAELLRVAGDEHPAVIEVGLEAMLERWMIRQFAESWMTARRQSDIVLWSQGTRRGGFEFSHNLIQDAIYGEISPLRRQVIHRQVASALEELYDHDHRAVCESLATHYHLAHLWERALGPTEEAARHARDLGAADTARHYYGLAIEALGKLRAGDSDGGSQHEWEQLSELFERNLKELRET